MRYVDIAEVVDDFAILSYISRLVNEAIEISLYQNFNREVQHRLEDHHPYSKRTVRFFNPTYPN
jgi:hypothetical protein